MSGWVECSRENDAPFAKTGASVRGLEGEITSLSVSSPTSHVIDKALMAVARN